MIFLLINLMTYEQKRESWQQEMNPELDLLKLRIDDIVDFVDQKIINSENAVISSIFKEKEQWEDNLIEIKNLLENNSVKMRMIEESDYSDIVGNFYNPFFLFFKRIENGKPLKNQIEILESVRAKTSEFLNYLRAFKKEERKVA